MKHWKKSEDPEGAQDNRDDMSYRDLLEEV